MYYSKPIPQIVQDHCTKHAPHCVGCTANCKAPTNDADFAEWVGNVIHSIEKFYEGKNE